MRSGAERQEPPVDFQGVLYPPTYSAVRSILRILGEKKLVRHKEDGPRYVYSPADTTDAVREDMLAHVVKTYFAGSTEQAVTALLRMSDRNKG